MKRRHITADQLNTLLSRGLSDREFRREVEVIEFGSDEAMLRDLQARRDFAAKLYRDELDAALLRARDGSLQECQLQGLAQAFAEWRDAVRALVEFQRGETL